MNQQYITPKKKNPNLVNGQSAMNNLSNGNGNNTTPLSQFVPSSGANAGPGYLPTFGGSPPPIMPGGSPPPIMPEVAPTGGQNVKDATGYIDNMMGSPTFGKLIGGTGPQAGFPPPGFANGQSPANIQPPSMPQPSQAPTGYSTVRMDIPRFETWMGRQDAAREAARFFTDVWNADPQTKAKLSAEYGGVTKKGNLKFFKTQQEVLANPLFGGEAPWHNLAVQGAAAFGGDEEAFMEWANDMVAEEATRAMEQTGKQEIVSGEQGAVLPVQIGDVITSDPKQVIDDAAIAKLGLEHPDWKPGETSQVQQDLALKFNQNSAIMKQGTTPEAKDAAFQQILDDYGKGLVSEGAFQQVLTSNPQIANDPRVATTMSIRNAALAGQQNGAVTNGTVTNGTVTNGVGQNGTVSNGTAAMGQLANGTNGTKDYVSWNDMTPEQRDDAISQSLQSFYASQDKQGSTIVEEPSQVVGKDQDYKQEWYESPETDEPGMSGWQKKWNELKQDEKAFFGSINNFKDKVLTKINQGLDPRNLLTTINQGLDPSIIGVKNLVSGVKDIIAAGSKRHDAFGKEILKESDYNKRFSELKTEAERADFQSKYSFQNAQEIADSASNMYPNDEFKQKDLIKELTSEGPGGAQLTQEQIHDLFVNAQGGRDVGQPIATPPGGKVIKSTPLEGYTYPETYPEYTSGSTKANASTAAATVSGDPLFVPEKTGEFKGIIDYFNASDEERKTMTHPLTELIFDASTGELSGESFERLNAFMKLRAGESARKDFLANQRIDNLASIGMVEVDGVMQPTDVALRNRAQLTQDLSGIANDVLTPQQVENYLKGTVDADMQQKLVKGYQAKRDKVAEELKILQAQSLLQDANKQSILAEIGVRERDISLAEKQQEFTEGIAEREMSLAEKQQADALGISGRELTLAEKAQADALGISGRELTLAEKAQADALGISGRELTLAEKAQADAIGISEREMLLSEEQQEFVQGIAGREMTLAEKQQADALGISERDMTLAEKQQGQSYTIARQEQARKDKQFLLEEERFGEEVLAKQQELDRLDSELDWQKSHSAEELAERIKTREAQTDQFQAELTNIAEREESQRIFQKTMTEMQQTFETGMAESDRSHETQMMQQQLSHDTSMQQLQQQTQFATQAMSMLSNNPSALYALQRLPGLESLAQLLGIGRIGGGAQVPGMPTSAIPTIGSLQEAGPQAAQQAQTMAGLTQGLTPQGFAQQVRSVTPGGGFAQGPISMGGITRTGRA